MCRNNSSGIKTAVHVTLWWAHPPVPCGLTSCTANWANGSYVKQPLVVTPPICSPRFEHINLRENREYCTFKVLKLVFWMKWSLRGTWMCASFMWIQVTVVDTFHPEMQMWPWKSWWLVLCASFISLPDFQPTLPYLQLLASLNLISMFIFLRCNVMNTDGLTLVLLLCFLLTVLINLETPC